MRVLSGGFLQSGKEKKIKREKKDAKGGGRKREENEGGWVGKRACDILHHTDHECLIVTPIRLSGFPPAPCVKPVVF